MRLPGVRYNSQAVTKFVYFHAPPREDGPRPKSLFNGISDIFVGRKRPDLVRECEAHINMDEDGLGPSDSSDAGFVGLTVNHTKPHKVMQVYDIRDQHDCRQGDPGYQNVAVHPSDALIQVDGIDLEHKSITEVHALIRGRRADPKMTWPKTRCLTTMGVGHIDHQPRRRNRRDTDRVPVHSTADAADAADATVAADADDTARRQARARRGLHERRAGARAG